MKLHLVRVDPVRAARIAAIIFLLVGLAALPFLYYDLVLAPEHLGFSRTIVFVLPFLVAGIAYASTALGCVVYNWLGGKAGCFEAAPNEGEQG